MQENIEQPQQTTFIPRFNHTHQTTVDYFNYLKCFEFFLLKRFFLASRAGTGLDVP